MSYLIFVYNDYGSSSVSVSQLDECLRVIFPSARVESISACQIQDGKLISFDEKEIEIENRLLCLGGGFDLGYMKTLGELGCEQICYFVAQGF